MSKLIYVQAQADHIASLAKASPVAALEELVWNALDADARNVTIDLVRNALGAVDAVRISDDGTGIDILKTDSTFGSLGGSWKRSASGTLLAHRKVHGHRGCGRFKAFALGSRVEWRTTTRAANELISYAISGTLENPGVFEIAHYPAPGPATGTEVFISGAFANCDVLLNAEETVQALAARFALYLRSYPGIRIYFCGLPVTPVIVQNKETEYEIQPENGTVLKLRIIEWKRRFTGAGKLVFSGTDGFCLYERNSPVRSGGISFTAYLVSQRFIQMNAENMLELDELNPELRMYLDAAAKTLKKHFTAVQAEAAESSGLDAWKRDGSYPVPATANEKTRGKFDRLATSLSEALPSFGSLPVADRAIILKHLYKALEK